jgi:hypothetical protein
MKRLYVNRLIDLILEPPVRSEQKLKSALQKAGVDVDGWRKRMREFFRKLPQGWEAGREKGWL